MAARAASILLLVFAIAWVAPHTPALAGGPIRPPSPAAGSAVTAQVPEGARRLATTVGALAAYPVFFHTQAVRVRGALRPDRRDLVLAQGADAVLVVGPAVAGAVPDASDIVEVLGTFLDVGRLTEGDPRLAGLDVRRLSEERLGKPWPGINELLLVSATDLRPADPFPAPSVVALALVPERYADSQVTVRGRFRGRNLYGDQPDAPGRSRWDFVLQSPGGASIWVVGLRPRGDGFDLRLDARVDTGRWLEVAGVVRRDRHLVFLEGRSIRQAQAPADPPPSEPAARVPAVGPPPEVVFSAPTQDETDVSRSTTVRIQFSRDLDPASIQGHVRAGYLASQAAERGEPQPPAMPPFAVAYNEGTRVLEIRFEEPLDRFRTVRIELTDGIRATDGAALVPWSLTFGVGG
jgi:hypothetical protein